MSLLIIGSMYVGRVIQRTCLIFLPACFRDAAGDTVDEGRRRADAFGIDSAVFGDGTVRTLLL